MDPELASIIRVALRTILIIQPTVIIANTYLMYRLLGLTGRLREIVIFFSIRIVLLNLTGTIGLHYYGSLTGYQVFYAVVLLALNFMSLWIVWRNFAGSIVKVLLATWIGDLINGGLGAAVISIVNEIRKSVRPTSIFTEELLLPVDLLIPLLFFAAFLVVLKITGPVIEAYRNTNREPAHKILFWIIFWCIFLTMTHTGAAWRVLRKIQQI